MYHNASRRRTSCKKWQCQAIALHLVKAGFVDKRQAKDDWMSDEFTVTDLGKRELKENRDSLTVGYLKSLYQ